MVDWEELSRIDQDIYLNKAKFLIDYQYMSGDVENLAEIIYRTCPHQARDSEQELP